MIKSGYAKIPVSNRFISTGYFISELSPSNKAGNITEVKLNNTINKVAKNTNQETIFEFCLNLFFSAVKV